MAWFCGFVGVAAAALGQMEPTPHALETPSSPAPSGLSAPDAGAASTTTPGNEKPQAPASAELGTWPTKYTLIDSRLRTDRFEHAVLYETVQLPPKPVGGYDFALLGGIQRWPLAALRTALVANGYAPVPSLTGTFGLLAGASIKRFCLALEFGGTGIDVAGPSGVRGRVSYVAMETQLGYYLYRDITFGVYPLLGVGLGAASVLGGTRDPKLVPILRGQIDRLDAAFRVQTTVLLIDFGVGAHALIRFSKGASSGLGVGLQAGYLVQPLHADWGESGRDAVYDGPKADVGGLYARLALGFSSQEVTHESSRMLARSCAGPACELACDPGYASCDHDPRNGCETLLGTVDNCARCGDRCSADHAQGVCVTRRCELQSCAPNFADCNQSAEDGCEVDLRVDPKHCGTCGHACSEGVSCVAGACYEPAAVHP
jgi:hypothetical protein